MATLQSIIQYILDLGPSIFVALIIFILGLIVGAKVTRALSAAITLGVAFAGVSLVIGYMVGGIAPAGQALDQRHRHQANCTRLRLDGWRSHHLGLEVRRADVPCPDRYQPDHACLQLDTMSECRHVECLG